MKPIVFYGKGGIGKSTIVANIAFLFHQEGHRVLQVGCDPKHDSASKHIQAHEIRTVMDEFNKNPQKIYDPEWIKGLVMVGRNGVHCLETGGPEPGKGCAGRAISLVLDLFKTMPSFVESYDIRIFDVLGDVVCGGFASPLRSGAASDIYIVVSGEPMALYAANNIVKGILNLSRDTLCVPGLIANLRNSPGEKAIITEFSKKLGVKVLGFIPRDEKVYMAELNSMTASEMFPDSGIVKCYKKLLKEIISENGNQKPKPIPLSDQHLENLYKHHLKNLLKNGSKSSPS